MPRSLRYLIVVMTIFLAQNCYGQISVNGTDSVAAPPKDASAQDSVINPYKQDSGDWWGLGLGFWSNPFASSLKDQLTFIARYEYRTIFPFSFPLEYQNWFMKGDKINENFFSVTLSLKTRIPINKFKFFFQGGPGVTNRMGGITAVGSFGVEYLYSSSFSYSFQFRYSDQMFIVFEINKR